MRMPSKAEWIGSSMVLGVFLAGALAGCVADRSDVPIWIRLLPYINQPQPLYTGGLIPCSNARLHERVLCPGTDGDFHGDEP